MAKCKIKIFVINWDHNQKIILKIVVSIKCTTKLLKILLKFALEKKFLQILESNLKILKSGNILNKNFWNQEKFILTSSIGEKFC